MSKQPVNTIETKKVDNSDLNNHKFEDSNLNKKDNVEDSNLKGKKESLLNNDIVNMGNNLPGSCSAVLRGKGKKKFQVNIVNNSKKDPNDDAKLAGNEIKKVKDDSKQSETSLGQQDASNKTDDNISNEKSSPKVCVSDISAQDGKEPDKSLSCISKTSFTNKFLEKKSSLSSSCNRGHRARHNSFHGLEKHVMRPHRTNSVSSCDKRIKNKSSSSFKGKNKKVKVVENKSSTTSDEENGSTMKNKMDLDKIRMDSKKEKGMKIRERKMSRSIQQSSYPGEEESDEDISVLPQKLDKDSDDAKKEPEEEKVIAASPSGRFLKFDLSIGRGSFKAVFKGLDTETGVHVAWCELQVWAFLSFLYVSVIFFVFQFSS